MKDLREILVATDLSNDASATYAHAAGLALGYGARVTLLHVKEVLAPYRTSREVAAYFDRVASQHEAELVGIRDWFAEWGIVARIEIVTGRASQQIVEAAERREAGLVVVGKSGQRGIEQFLFGTTTKRVLRKVGRPLLVVPPGLHSEANDWHPVVFNRLMTTTDFGEDSKRGLALALWLARALDASDLLLTHVLRPPARPNISEMDAIADSALDMAREDAQSRLVALAQRLDSQRVSTRLLLHEGVAHGIAVAAEEEAVDLIVVPSHGRSALGAAFLGSISEGVLRRARRPVLVLPRPYLDLIFGR